MICETTWCHGFFFSFGFHSPVHSPDPKNKCMKLNIKYTYYPIEIDGQLNEKYFNCVLFLLLNSMNDVLFVEQQQQQIAPNSEIYNKNPHGSHANYLLELNCNILLFIAFRFFFLLYFWQRSFVKCSAFPISAHALKIIIKIWCPFINGNVCQALASVVNNSMSKNHKQYRAQMWTNRERERDIRPTAARAQARFKSFFSLFSNLLYRPKMVGEWESEHITQVELIYKFSFGFARI